MLARSFPVLATRLDIEHCEPAHALSLHALIISARLGTHFGEVPDHPVASPLCLRLACCTVGVLRTVRPATLLTRSLLRFTAAVPWLIPAVASQVYPHRKLPGAGGLLPGCILSYNAAAGCTIWVKGRKTVRQNRVRDVFASESLPRSAVGLQVS